MGVLNSFYYVGQILASGIAVSISSQDTGLLVNKSVRSPSVGSTVRPLGEDHSTFSVFPLVSTSSLCSSSTNPPDGFSPKAKRIKREPSWLSSTQRTMTNTRP